MNKVSGTVPPIEKIKPASSRSGVTVYYIRKAIKDGKLSYTKIGNCFMVNTDELQKLIESNTHRNG